MRYLIVCLAVCLFAGGCAAPTEQMKQLQVENSRLQSDLSSAKSNIEDLEGKNAQLTDQVRRLTKISGTLAQEKAVRVEESSQLRQEVRAFLREQMSSLREFSKNEDFLDYRGGELIRRTGDIGKSAALIDTLYRMNEPGILFGVRGQFAEPSRLSMAVLREVAGEWVVVWKTELIEITRPGIQNIDFPVPVTVQKDDLVAYLFPDNIPIACEQGTGGIVPVDKMLQVGQKLDRTVLGSHQGWACSIGVVGVLGD